MIRALYRYDHYGERLVQSMRQFTPSSAAARRTPKHLSGRDVATIGRILGHFLLTRDRARRSFFLKTVWQSMRERPSMQKLIVTVSFLTLHKHFHEYVDSTHGDPETAGPASPFAGREKRAPGLETTPAGATRPVAPQGAPRRPREAWRAPAEWAGSRN